MRKFDAIVVGVGTMGSSACYHLAKVGANVLGLDQFDIPHHLGSGHGYSRMIRLAYFEHTDYVVLLRRAFELWDQLEADSGQKLLHTTGGLYMGRPDCALVSGSRRAVREHEIAHRLLNHQQLADAFPQFNLPDSFVALHEPKAGFLVPERVIAAQAEQSLSRGAELHGHEPVGSWEADRHGVTVRTDCDQYRADKLILTSGAWSRRLMGELRVDLTVTRQVMGWTWPRRPELFQLGSFPAWAIDMNDAASYAGIHYGFPMMPDNPGFKVSLHWPAQTADPDQVERGPMPGDEQTFRPILRDCVPDADGPLLALRTCLYTNSPDGHFIIDHHPLPHCHGRVVVACGFSGHGFKFASVVGEVLAELARNGKSQWPVDLFGISRFGR